jgi:hypothetical protein
MRLSHRTLRAAITAGIIAVSATAIVASATATTVRRCRAGQLSATMTHIFGSEGAGSTGYRLNLKNHGRHRCRLGNHPGLELLGANGKGLSTHVKAFGQAGTVTIRAGHTAKARLRFSPDIPGPGEPAKGPCEPKAHSVKVFLKAPARGSLLGPVEPPTSVCEHGSIQEQPLR